MKLTRILKIRVNLSHVVFLRVNFRDIIFTLSEHIQELRSNTLLFSVHFFSSLYNVNLKDMSSGIFAVYSCFQKSGAAAKIYLETSQIALIYITL